jgi:PKD repeat protein
VGGVGATARIFGNAGMLKLMRARDQKQPQAARPRCPRIKDVDARVGRFTEHWGAKEENKVMQDHAATFSFNGFVATEGCRNLSYRWTFGDGTTSPDLTTTHTYTRPGRYIATLTVSCADCPDVIELSDSVHVAAVEIRQHGLDASGSPEDPRTRLGVGEQQFFDVYPLLPGMSARVRGEGTAELLGMGLFRFKAPAIAGRSILFIEHPAMNSFATTFATLQPTAMTMHLRDPNEVGVMRNGPVVHGAGVYLEELRARLHAIDDEGVEHPVRFDNLEVSCRSARAEELEGYFATMAPGWVFSTPAVNWRRVVDNFVLDLTTVVSDAPPEWTNGSCLCVRRWFYRVAGTSTEHELTTTPSYLVMEGEGSKEEHEPGTMTLYEGEICWSRAPSGIGYTCR